MVRSPMQVDDEFRIKIKKIQEQIMRKKGRYDSIPTITKKIVSVPEWDAVEKRLLNEIRGIEFKINLDRRI